jgi:citrate synthase
MVPSAFGLKEITMPATGQAVGNGTGDAPAGLEGVVVAHTGIGDVRGLEGFYHYRQYDAIELNRRRSLEDVWHLLFRGHLPNQAELADFRREIAGHRELPGDLIAFLQMLVRTDPYDPMTALRTAISFVAQRYGFRPWLDITPDELYDNALQLSAQTPVLIAALHRLRAGQEPVPPDPELSAAANFLYMFSGEKPDDQRAWALERYLTATIDHGFNNSTFTARVIASTGADIGAAVTGAIGALSGPLHGGAPARVLEMLDDIGSPDKAEAWVRAAVGRGERIMGFGHRVYKGKDPRSELLREVAATMGGPTAEFAMAVEDTIVRVLGEEKPGRHLNANVEFYGGVVMDACGIARQEFTPTFASSRVIGWCTHVLEQVSGNRLIRPAARYDGEAPPQPVPAAGS